MLLWLLRQCSPSPQSALSYYRLFWWCFGSQHSIILEVPRRFSQNWDSLYSVLTWTQLFSCSPSNLLWHHHGVNLTLGHTLVSFHGAPRTQILFILLGTRNQFQDTFLLSDHIWKNWYLWWWKSVLLTTLLLFMSFCGLNFVLSSLLRYK